MKNLLLIILSIITLLASIHYTSAQEKFKTQVVDFKGLQKILAVADGGDLHKTNYCQTFKTKVDLGLFATKSSIQFCCVTTMEGVDSNCTCVPGSNFKTDQDGSFSITRSSSHVYHGYFITIRMGAYQLDAASGLPNIKFIIAEL